MAHVRFEQQPLLTQIAESSMATTMIMRTLLAICVVGFVAGMDDDGSSFDVSAYPVKWDDDGSSPGAGAGSFDVAAPPCPDGEAPAPAPPPRHHLMVKKGMLFLKRNLFVGALLPGNTQLGATSPAPVYSSTSRVAPPFRFGSLDKILNFYNITRGSKKAGEISATLRLCEEAGDKDKEPQACATSVAAARAFASSVLGTKEPRAASTSLHGRKEPLRYMVAPKGIATVGGDAVVPCQPGGGLLLPQTQQRTGTPG